MAKKDSKNEKPQRQEIPALEWLAAIIGFVLVASAIGYLIFSAVTQDDSPPKLVIEDYNISEIESGYLVKFTLSNNGENNAADIVVEGKIAGNENESETSSVTIDYAPSHSKREGALLFTRKPVKGENFKIRALGFNDP